MFKIRSYVEEENYLFSQNIKKGVLITEDSTENRYAHTLLYRVNYVHSHTYDKSYILKIITIYLQKLIPNTQACVCAKCCLSSNPFLCALTADKNGHNAVSVTLVSLA